MIDKYEFGRIQIDGKTFTSDVIIYKDSVDGSWWRKEGHKLSLGDISKIIDEKPAILIIGIGADGCMDVPAPVVSAVESKGIRVIVNKTADACKEYNRLAPSVSVVAALHLTC